MGVASDAKTYLESIEVCAMINGIKGSAEVEKKENSEFSPVMALMQLLSVMRRAVSVE